MKNQGGCGSCAAFASAGMMEAVIAKAYEAKSGGKQKQQFGDKLQKLDMSEQYLLDCAYLQWPLVTDSRGGKIVVLHRYHISSIKGIQLRKNVTLPTLQ